MEEKKQNTIQNKETGENNNYAFNKTVLLIIVLFIIASFFVYLAVFPKNKSQTKVVIIPTPTPYAQTVLSLVKEKSSTNSANTVDIVVNSGINTVNVVQAIIAFNPKDISKISLVKGSFFSNPAQLIKDINYNDGRIDYALGIVPGQKGVRGSGVLAKIVYEVNSSSINSTTTFSFITNKSFVGSAKTVASTLKQAIDLTFPLSPQLNTATPSSR